MIDLEFFCLGFVSGLFRPLLKSETPSFEQLRKLISNEVKNSEAGASELAVKLLTCNENVNILRQILSTVANRGLKMRDHIKRILDGGQYHFTVYDMACHLRLSIGSHTTAAQKSDSDRALKEEKGVYVLADLQDFRSRARLVMSSHVMQARRLDIHSSGTFFWLLVTSFCNLNSRVCCGGRRLCHFLDHII
jgi:hypothetical protein